MSDATAEQQEQIKEVFRRHSGALARGEFDVRTTTFITHDIKLYLNAQPVKQRCYRVPPKQRPFLGKFLHAATADNTIEHHRTRTSEIILSWYYLKRRRISPE